MNVATRVAVARAPGKLILSGEHAVVYGAPALALAVNRYVTVTARACPEPVFRLQANSFTSAAELEFAATPALVASLEARHADFLAGRLPVSEILNTPTEFVFHAAAQVMRAAPTPGTGCELSIESQIPFGSGLGSSAALALAVPRALTALWNVPVHREQLYIWACETEKLRHGRSSGLDPRVCLTGGGLRFEADRYVPLSRLPVALTLVQTGVPLSGTGVCVQAVAQRFGIDGPWTAMRAATERLSSALQNQAALQEAIHAQQCLLEQLGVTPAPVMAFIRAVEAAGGAAKICGAGAVEGPAAGIVWVVGPPALEALACSHGYEVLIVRPARHGVRLRSLAH